MEFPQLALQSSVTHISSRDGLCWPLGVHYGWSDMSHGINKSPHTTLAGALLLRGPCLLTSLMVGSCFALVSGLVRVLFSTLNAAP